MEPRDPLGGQRQGLGKRPWGQAVFTEVVHLCVRKSGWKERAQVLQMRALGKTCLLSIAVGSSEAVEIYLFCSPWDPIKRFLVFNLYVVFPFLWVS